MKIQEAYHILGVNSSDSAEIIKKQYKKLALEYHPDKHAGDNVDWATKKMQEINEAYETIIHSRDSVDKDFDWGITIKVVRPEHPKGPRNPNGYFIRSKFMLKDFRNLWNVAEKRFYKENVGDVTGFTIFTQAARIVKANQILRWFVGNVMSGKADKEHHEVTNGQLKQLARACRCVRETIIQVSNGDSENPQFSVDEHVAKQHLPLIDTPGFFFGTNQYGTVYAADVIRTLRAVERILHTTDFEKEAVYFNAIW